MAIVTLYPKTDTWTQNTITARKLETDGFGTVVQGLGTEWEGIWSPATIKAKSIALVTSSGVRTVLATNVAAVSQSGWTGNAYATYSVGWACTETICNPTDVLEIELACYINNGEIGFLTWVTAPLGCYKIGATTWVFDYYAQLGLAEYDSNYYTECYLTFGTSTYPTKILNVDIVVNYPPTAPTDLATSNTDGTPRLSWTFNDPDAGNQTAFQVIVERNSAGSWVAHKDTGKITSANAYYDILTVNRLAANTEYRFRVKAWDDADESSPYSTNFAWTTSGPYVASGTYETEAIATGRDGTFVRTGTVSWVATIPTDTTLTAEIATSDDGVTFSAYSAVTSGATLSPVAYVKLKFTFGTTYDLSTAELQSVTVAFPEEYEATATVTSAVVDVETTVGEAYEGSITQFITIPAGTTAAIEMRGSANGSTGWSEWAEVENLETLTYYPFVQYRAVFASNTARSATPTVTSIALAYLTSYHASGTWVSPVLDLEYLTPESTAIAWVVGSQPTGTGVTVELSTSHDGITWTAYEAQTSGQPFTDVDYFVKARVTLTSDTTGEYTPTLSSLTLTATNCARVGLWRSPVIECANATDKGSGQVVLESLTPGGSTISSLTRSSLDQVTWTDWVATNAQGEFQHADGDFAQVEFLLTPSGASLPSIQKATVNFDGAPTVTLLADDFTPGAQFQFASLLDYSVITNGLDVPRKYDGTDLTTLAGDPPRGYYTATHKNRLWMLRGSRLYFSDLLDVETWPVLNFIDISPNDGDTGTGLLPSGDYLIITKKNSTWLLIGDSIDNYSVRRLSATRGAIAPRSLVMMNELFVFVSDDGIYICDFAQTALSSERLRKTWDGLNHRRLGQAVTWFAKQKLYVCAPSVNSAINDTVMVYDTLREAWCTIKGWKVSCSTNWVEAGQQVTLVGHADEGQASEINSGANNAGEAIECIWESKHFDGKAPDIEKRFRQIQIMVTPHVQPVTLEVQFVTNGGTPTDAVSVVVPGRTDKRTEVVEIDPARSGVHYARSIGFIVRQATLNAGVGIRAVNLSFYLVNNRPTIRG